MLTKTNIYSVRNYLSGNTDRQQWCRRCPPRPEKVLQTPMNDRAFRYFRAFTHCELFVPFRSSCYYLIKVTCNNICYIQITMGVIDYSKRQLKTVRFPIWRALL